MDPPQPIPCSPQRSFTIKSMLTCAQQKRAQKRFRKIPNCCKRPWSLKERFAKTQPKVTICINVLFLLCFVQVGTSWRDSSSVWTGPGSPWRKSTTWWMRTTSSWRWCSGGEAIWGRRLSLVSLPLSLPFWSVFSHTTDVHGPQTWLRWFDDYLVVVFELLYLQR